ncbi:MAG: pur operon repressor [Acidaminococcaceae bacterium]
MSRVKRMERVVALTKELIDHPYELFPFAYFCEKFAVAKSTLSEDVQAVRNGLAAYDLGVIETVAGAAGGVRFISYHSQDADTAFLQALAVQLAEPERILSGGMIYMNDLLFTPHIIMRLGEIMMQRTQQLAPDYIMTVETKGIPLALFVARAYNVPLVMARRESRITEGSAVSINYVSGSTKRIQTMSLPKRALPPGAKVLIIDDFLKAGGTAKGMQELTQEVGAEVVGTGFLIATKEPEKKMVEDYFALFVLDGIDDERKLTDIKPL